MDAFFSPRTVAVIGATEAADSLFANLTTGAFQGKVFHVNAAAFPERVDLAVIATPAAAVPGVIRDCAAAGVKAAVIVTSLELEPQVLADARQGRMRIIGPNSIGLMNPLTGLNASSATSIARPGNLGFISQSGALCMSILDWTLREKVGFSAFVSVGSMVDVGWGDLIYHLGDDRHTRSIVIYMESIGDPGAFMSAAREVALNKPIIVIKAGRTGSLAGSDDVLDAAFRRCGVLRVDRLSDLFYISEALGKQPRPRGPRLTILSNARGPALLATDALIADGGQLAALAPQTLDYAGAMEIAAKDPNSDGLLVLLSPQWMTSPSEIATSLTPFAKLYGKPVLASWMGGDQVAEGERILNDAGIPTFPFPDTAAHVFNYMWRYSFNLRSLYETPAYPEDAPEIDAAGARKVIGKAGSEGRVLLTEAESSQVLAAYGIPVAETRVAGSELTLGSRVDPQFGPVILFSAGGECALGLPPLNTTLARRLMEQTRIYRALPDPDALEQLVVRFSQLVTEQRWIQEIDVNPREARIVLHHPNRLESELPKTAIRPYPSQYVTQWKAKDGTGITIRPIRPEDEPMMVRFHETLSDESVYFRYFYLIKLGQRIEHERLTRQCFVDYNRDMALVAERDDPETGQRAIVAVGRMNKLHGVNEAEVAVIVSDRHQKMGLGTQLVTSLLAIARKEKLSRLVASVLPGNRGMQQVFEGLGFQMKYSPEEEVVQAELTL